jgi:hypothetical protein
MILGARYRGPFGIHDIGGDLDFVLRHEKAPDQMS